jgi:PAS domain S-box-containing protein
VSAEPISPNSRLKTRLSTSLIDLLPDFLIVIDDDGTILEWNQRAAAVFEFKRNEAIGQKIIDLLGQTDFTRQSIKLMYEQLASSNYWEGEIACNLRDGRQAWFFIRAKQLAFNDGRKGLMVIDTFLTNYELRHHAVQAVLDYSQKELSNILSAVGDMICSYDIHNKKFQFVSPSCYSLTGYSEYELMDHPELFMEMILPEHRPLMEEAFDTIENGEIKLEYCIQRKDGTTCWVLNSMSPIIIDVEGQGKLNVICVITDTTTYREIDELKSRMMRMASHDLNNPLSTAVGFFQLLVTDLEHLLDDEQRQMVKSIQSSHNRMGRMLEELLNLEQYENDEPLQLEPLQIDCLIDEVIEAFTFQIQDKQHKIIFEHPQTSIDVQAERVQLEHALSNYISNAIKYTPEQGKIVIQVFLDGDHVVFETTDNGIGIPSHAQENLFKAFYRAKQPGTENIDGTGLGLSLVKSIIIHHGGDVYYRPSPSGGSTFGFWLPSPNHTS